MWCIMGTAASRGSTQHITAQWLNTTAKKSGHLFGILRFTSWSAGNSEMESRTRGVSIRAIQSKVMEDDDGQYWINEILYVSPYSCHWVTFHMYFMKYCLWVLNFCAAHNIEDCDSRVSFWIFFKHLWSSMPWVLCLFSDVSWCLCNVLVLSGRG